jgi:geranylgeranyl pyrophosphate synthase
MWQIELANLLKEEIELSVSVLPEELRGFIREPLTVSRRGLAVPNNQEPPWILLPVIVYESIGSSPEKALPLCASLQFFMTAGDVFDDVEDDDAPLSLSSRYGMAITNNIATTLLVLGEKAIAGLKEKKVNDSKIVRILDTINHYYLKACTGQHLDLSYGNKLDISENEYLDILSLKSASQIECACYTGALLATDNNKLLGLFKNFGYNLGMMLQITNDIAGIISKKDIINKKITFPVIFALSQTESTVHDKLEQYYGKQNGNELSSDQVSDILSETGAMHYSAIITESYRLSAKEAAERAESNGVNIDKMRIFLQ